ncbi:hypothetical protein NDU88_003332 [Pleurodeles waltl]|uniref:Uncharacterized protein n=1 Tax=Pleurodeles waltl TaxID=8319 RepID=A0AAV7T588_PLEWA|nr:hypothetical protein NDU88_003332 [Pleurodeles waltl]
MMLFPACLQVIADGRTWHWEWLEGSKAATHVDHHSNKGGSAGKKKMAFPTQQQDQEKEQVETLASLLAVVLVASSVITHNWWAMQHAMQRNVQRGIDLN